MNGQIYYHFLPSQYAIHDLERKMIKVSTLDTLNDPFELMPYLRYGDRKKIRHYLDVRNRISKEYGLLCFSETWEEPLIWSHYADKHKGIALGFKISNYQIFKVAYDPNPMRKQFELTHDSVIDNQLFLDLAKVKYEKWDYEKEHRILIKLAECILINGYHFIQFGNSLLVKEVRLGSYYNYNDNSADYIFKLSKSLNADVIPCRLERQGYKINRDGKKAEIFEKIKKNIETT